MMLERLYYKNRLSMVEIADKLNITSPIIGYWMKKHKLSRRSNSESTYCKLNPDGDPFSVKSKLNRQERDLMLTGLMLYWGEGSKTAKSSLQLANLDHRMLQIFVKFLREICRIHEEKLRLFVRVYKKFDKDKAKKYWAKTLKMSTDRIFVYPHTDKRSKVHKQWSEYGIATLQCHNLKLREWIAKAIEKHIGKTVKAR